jgi:hypothetical protein
MRTLVKFGVSAVVVLGFALACNNSTAIPQAIVASNVQVSPASPGQCNSPEQFIYVPQSAGVPGPDTSDNTNITTDVAACEAGVCDTKIACSVIPNGSGYNVDLTAQITGGTAPGTLHITGLMLPRTRDPNGNPTAAGDSTKMPGFTMNILDPTKHLQETDCYAEYVLADNGSPGTSLSSLADVFADDKGGRVWASVFCPTLKNLDTNKSGLDGCMASTTFRFENCASK